MKKEATKKEAKKKEVKAKKAPKGQVQKDQPGDEYKMDPRPESTPDDPEAGRLEGKVAIISGGDSGIGRAVALAFVAEGASVVLAYLDEKKDAEETKKLVGKAGGDCLLISADITEVKSCERIVAKTIDRFKKIDILVNNAAVQYPQNSLADITDEQLDKTFKTNILSYFYLTRAALPYLKKGASIINTTSVTAYRGSGHLIDYASTKGAIVGFTRSLATNLAKKGIRVNGVAPGPIWTPLIPSSFTKKQVAEFGKDVPLGRPGQPNEVAPSYVFLASDDASYMTGQIIHPNGGEIING